MTDQECLSGKTRLEQSKPCETLQRPDRNNTLDLLYTWI